VTVSNLGRIAVRNLTMTVHCNNSIIPLLNAGGSLTVPAGGSETVNGAFYFQPQADWTRIDTICNFEARAGAPFEQFDSWHFHHRPNFFWEHLGTKLRSIDPPRPQTQV
jgi:hypothetical protein